MINSEASLRLLSQINRIFKGCPPGESARLALLRRELERLASTEEGKAELIKKAPAVGVTPQRLEIAKSGIMATIVGEWLVARNHLRAFTARSAVLSVGSAGWLL
jgi:hypothetical protein